MAIAAMACVGGAMLSCVCVISFAQTVTYDPRSSEYAPYTSLIVGKRYPEAIAIVKRADTVNKSIVVLRQGSGKSSAAELNTVYLFVDSNDVVTDIHIRKHNMESSSRTLTYSEEVKRA